MREYHRFPCCIHKYGLRGARWAPPAFASARESGHLYRYKTREKGGEAQSTLIVALVALYWDMLWSVFLGSYVHIFICIAAQKDRTYLRWNEGLLQIAFFPPRLKTANSARTGVCTCHRRNVRSDPRGLSSASLGSC